MFAKRLIWLLPLFVTGIFGAGDLKYGLKLASKAVRAVCYVEKAIPPPPVNYGVGERLLSFERCHDYEMDFLTNDYDDCDQEIGCISKAIKEKMTTFFPNYVACNPLIDDPQGKPKADYSKILEDSEGGEYPYRGFAHCLLETLEKLKPKDVFERVKARWKSPKPVEQIMLDRQNEYRKFRGVPPLTLDPELTKRASKWAKFMTDEKQWHNDIHSRYLSVQKPNDPDLTFKGSRIAELVALADTLEMSIQDRALAVVNQWYDEKSFYRWPFYNGKNANLDKIRSFTQTVWKSTTHVGYGAAHRKGTDDYLIVAFYWPEGNTVTEDFAAFKNNVLPVEAK